MGWGKPCDDPDCGCGSNCCHCNDHSDPVCSDGVTPAICVGGEWNCADFSAAQCLDAETPYNPTCVGCPCCVQPCATNESPPMWKLAGLSGIFHTHDPSGMGGPDACSNCDAITDPIFLSVDPGNPCVWTFPVPGNCDFTLTLSIGDCTAMGNTGRRLSLSVSGGSHACTAPSGGAGFQWDGPFIIGGTVPSENWNNICCKFTMIEDVSWSEPPSDFGSCCYVSFDVASGATLTLTPVPDCDCSECCNQPEPETLQVQWDWSGLVNTASSPCDTGCLTNAVSHPLLFNCTKIAPCHWQYLVGHLQIDVTLILTNTTGPPPGDAVNPGVNVCTFKMHAVDDRGCFDLTYYGLGNCGDVPSLTFYSGSQTCCVGGVGGCVDIDNGTHDAGNAVPAHAVLVWIC